MQKIKNKPVAFPIFSSAVLAYSAHYSVLYTI